MEILTHQILNYIFAFGLFSLEWLLFATGIYLLALYSLSLSVKDVKEEENLTIFLDQIYGVSEINSLFGKLFEEK